MTPQTTRINKRSTRFCFSSYLHSLKPCILSYRYYFIIQLQDVFAFFCTDSQKLYEQGTLKSSLARLFAIVYTSLRRKFPLESVILSRLHRCAVLSADNSELFCTKNQWRFTTDDPSSYFIWLGMRDSNPRMLGPEPSALPLGESPIHRY